MPLPDEVVSPAGVSALPSAGKSATWQTIDPERAAAPPFDRGSAGLNLAKIVLYIVGGVIVILMLYLVFMDLRIAADVAGAYKQVLNPSRIGSEFYTLDRLERFGSDLDSARTHPTQTLSTESIQNDQDVIKMLGDLPSLTSTQKAQLNQCVPLPTDSTRNEKLGQCITVIDDVRQSAIGAAASTTTAQMAAEAAGKIQDQRASLHQFWIQAAQLILLNLLLPLLTGLFGYIFGTQQASGKSGD
jgi:hypothetical protein